MSRRFPSQQVIDWMSKGILSPVIYRPLFSHLRFVTCRTFETLAANTIPLFGLDTEYVREIYGEPAVELVLPNDLAAAQQKVADIVDRPEHYAQNRDGNSQAHGGKAFVQGTSAGNG